MVKMKLESTVDNVRVDKYLADTLSYSRETITDMIKQGYILVNGQEIKPSYSVKLNDVIEVDESYIKPINVVPQKMDIDIVYEDDDILVINKPSGLVVHPGNGNYDNTLVNGLLYYTNNLSDGTEEYRPGIVHRLDKDTSGLMLVAKSNKAHEILADDFKNKKVHREYVALLDGVLPNTTAVVDAPIGRDKNHFQRYCVLAGGKKAITHLRVIKKYKDYTLVRLVLETGRTHQIRVHMAYIGYPVHNDPIYTNKKCSDFGQFLHSEKLDFIHPITKKKMSFERPVPKEFKDFLDSIE